MDMAEMMWMWQGHGFYTKSLVMDTIQHDILPILKYIIDFNILTTIVNNCTNSNITTHHTRIISMISTSHLLQNLPLKWSS